VEKREGGRYGEERSVGGREEGSEMRERERRRRWKGWGMKRGKRGIE
jgi:hypothetical protein